MPDNYADILEALDPAKTKASSVQSLNTSSDDFSDIMKAIDLPEEPIVSSDATPKTLPSDLIPKEESGYIRTAKDVFGEYADIPTSFVKGLSWEYIPSAETPEEAGAVHKVVTGAAHLAGLSVGLLAPTKFAGSAGILIKGAGVVRAALRGAQIGGAYGLIKKPDEELDETRLGNMVKDAKMFGTFMGAGGALATVAGKINPVIAETLAKVEKNIPLNVAEKRIYKAYEYGSSMSLGGGAGALEPAEDIEQRMTNVISGIGTFGLAHGMTEGLFKTKDLSKANTIRRGLAKDALANGDVSKAQKYLDEIHQSQPEVIEDVSTKLKDSLRKQVESQLRQDKIDKEMPNELEDTLALKAQARQSEIDKVMPKETIVKEGLNVIEGKKPTSAEQKPTAGAIKETATATATATEKLISGTKNLELTDKVGNDTLKGVIDKLLFGDKSALVDIHKGIDELGTLTIQHNIGNKLSAAIYDRMAKEEISYDEAYKKYQEIRPDVDKVLKGEKLTESEVIVTEPKVPELEVSKDLEIKAQQDKESENNLNTLEYASKKDEKGNFNTDDLNWIKDNLDKFKGIGKALAEKLIKKYDVKGTGPIDSLDTKMKELDKLNPKQLAERAKQSGLDTTVQTKALSDPEYVKRQIASAELHPKKETNENILDKKTVETEPAKGISELPTKDFEALRTKFNETISKESLSKEDVKWITENKSNLNLTEAETKTIKEKMVGKLVKRFMSEEDYNKSFGYLKSHFKGEKPYGEKLYSMGVDPELMRDISKVMVYHIEGGIKDFYQLSKKMIDEYGEGIRPHLHTAYQIAREHKELQEGKFEAPKSPTTKVANKLGIDDPNPDMTELGDKFSKPINTEMAAGKFADYALGTMSTRMFNIHPEIMNRLRKWAMHLGINNFKDTKEIAKFVKDTNKLGEQEQMILTYFLSNGEFDKARSMLADYEIDTAEFDKALEVKNRLWERYKVSGGKETKDVKNHWPRLIRDYKGLMSHLDKSTTSRIDEAVANIEKDTKELLTPEEKGAVVDKLLRGFGQGRITLSDPSFAKARTIYKYSPAMVKFLAPFHEALVNYVHSMNNNIEARKFFGKENINETIANKALKKMGLEIDSMKFSDADLSKSIGDVIIDIKNKGLIEKDSDMIRLKSMLHSIFKPGKVANWVSGVENLTYGSTITNLGSVMVQIQDMAFSAESADMYRAIKHAGKSLAGKSDVTLEDLGISAIHKELSNDGPLSFAVKSALDVIGFSKVERTSSEAAVNATYDKFKDMAFKSPEKLYTELRREYGFNDVDAKTVMEDLKSDRAEKDMDDGTRLLLFSVLSDVKPISILELPQAHADAKGKMSTLRLLYTLKRYQIKLFDVYRRKIFNQIKSGDKTEGLKRLVRLTTTLAIAGVGINALKDFWYGRDFDLSDTAVNSLFNIVGLTRYTPQQIKQEGIAGAAVKTIMPASFSILSNISTDIGVLYKDMLGENETEEGYEFPKYLSEPGKQYYYRVGEGRRKEEKRREQEDEE